MNNLNIAPKPKKGKKKVLFLAIILVIIAAIITSVVVVSNSNKPLKLYNAARETVFESGSITFTVTAKDEEGQIVGDISFGEGVDDSRADIKLEGTDGDDIQFILLENGELSGNSIGSSASVDELVEYYEALLPLEIDIMEYLNNIINGKIDEEELGKLYDNEILPLLEEQYSEEFDADIELPTYYETIKIIERFIKKGLSDEAVVMEKIDSEHKGKVYEVTIDAEVLTEDFIAFAKEDNDLSPLLEKLVEASDGAYESVDELAEDMIGEISGGEDIVFEVAIKSGRLTYIGFEDISIVIESEK